MSYQVIRGDARSLPLADESVDLIVTSPPYFALRSYRDGDEHYEGQLGSEPTPQEFLEALWTVTAECWRVLKPSGSMFVNLGDKYAGSGGHNNSSLAGPRTGEFGKRKHNDQAPRKVATRRNAPDRYNQSSDVPDKSLMGLPWTYANGCTGAYPFPHGMAAPDGQRWVLRAEMVWNKLNGLPESVTDRVRRSHEQFFHLTKQGRYFSAVDEIREPHMASTMERGGGRNGARVRPEGPQIGDFTATGKGSGWEGGANPLGKLPNSVWSVASEPLAVPEYLIEWEGGHRLCDPPMHWQLAQRLYAEGYDPITARDIDHFATFPTEWPRRLILGWSPSGICTACDEGRVPVVDKSYSTEGTLYSNDKGTKHRSADNGAKGNTQATITGYSCACDVPIAPTRPSVILDPFGGTGTTALVAHALGRHGISVDLSWDYSRLALWRIRDSGHGAKAASRTDRDRQGMLL